MKDAKQRYTIHDMGKGRFLNQKLGKRTSRRIDLAKSGVSVQRPGKPARVGEVRQPKKGFSRERDSAGSASDRSVPAGLPPPPPY